MSGAAAASTTAGPGSSAALAAALTSAADPQRLSLSAAGPLSPSSFAPPEPGAQSKASSKAIRRAEAAERRRQEQIGAEVVRAQSLAAARWSDCLSCLSSSLPLLQDNPYLCILQPPFLYDYLDSLTETLANLSSHSDDLQTVRSLLQRVYSSFIELGKFAKYQPAFYVDDAASIKRFVRLMEQVSHRSSDKALFPNILSLLTPTFSRTALYPMLVDMGILRCLLSFAVNAWIPTLPTSLMIFAILDEMTHIDEPDDATVSSTAPGWIVRRALQAEPGWERLCKLCWGRELGLSREQQARGQQALLWAEPDIPDDWKQGAADDDEDDDEDTTSAQRAAYAPQQPNEQRAVVQVTAPAPL